MLIDAPLEIQDNDAEDVIGQFIIPQLDGGPGSEDPASMLDRCKHVLDNLLRDKYDSFEVLSLAREFGIDIQIESSLSKQKLLLQKCVLDNIIKEDQSDYFRRLLKETEQMFSFQKRPGFSCCLAGCLFYADRHKSYIKHLQQVHSTYHRFSCQFRHKCNREFSLIGLLIEHIKESHSGSITTQGSYVSFPDINIACKCDMMSCGGKKF